VRLVPVPAAVARPSWTRSTPPNFTELNVGSFCAPPVPDASATSSTGLVSPEDTVCLNVSDVALAATMPEDVEAIVGSLSAVPAGAAWALVPHWNVEIS
jgi:hypothetical protein